MKKVYFAASIRGGRDEADVYPTIVAAIKNAGAEVLSEHFADSAITDEGTGGSSADIFHQDMAWVTEADAIIAEVTNPSLGVGYEIGRAEQMNKPILCLFRQHSQRSLSAMISGNPNLQVYEYQDSENLAVIIEDFLQ